ncbi:hypothetical protein ASE80_06515 [Pseudomonas sp. Leaf15]|nr:hypothetical protein ASE80_06515 [Pseudomonas sp. Leaf15]RAH04646.1 hypothetical protein DJ480_02595 [Pseudomonas sp. Leaf98]
MRSLDNSRDYGDSKAESVPPQIFSLQTDRSVQGWALRAQRVEADLTKLAIPTVQGLDDDCQGVQ